MADKILTLTNKDGTDNIYPVAGAMVADSVTTAMLQDGAVTSSKIDWTTLGYQSVGLSSQATVTSTAEYEYKAVPGLSITINGPVGAKYFVISAITARTPSGGYGDVYGRIHVDGTMVASLLVDTPSAGKSVSITTTAEVTATSSTQTIQAYVGGSATGTYTVGAYSRITVIRVA